MIKKYQIFISSTYEDLKEERACLVQSLLENDCIPVGMEYFPSSSMNQIQYIQKRIDDSDYYILILAGRYGSCTSDGISFTEIEYDYAVNKGKPVMSFIFKDIGKLTYEKCEHTNEGRMKLEAFREKVSKDKLVKYYTDISELKLYVIAAVNQCIKDFPSVGWIRGDSIHNSDTGIVSGVYTHAISVTTSVYENECDRGSFTFDYSNNNGRFTIGQGEYTFVTRWTKASDISIHACSDDVGIESIARIKKLKTIPSILSGSYDFSSRVRTPSLGDGVIWKNTNGKYAVTKIISILDDTRGADHDELTCDYIIYK